MLESNACSRATAQNLKKMDLCLLGGVFSLIWSGGSRVKGLRLFTQTHCWQHDLRLTKIILIDSRRTDINKPRLIDGAYRQSGALRICKAF